DFDGDGKLDGAGLVRFNGTTVMATCACGLILPDVFVPPIAVSRSADFDGDGLADLVLLNDVTKNPKNVTALTTRLSSQYGMVADQSTEGPVLADINGDGAPDVVTPTTFWLNAGFNGNVVLATAVNYGTGI